MQSWDEWDIDRDSLLWHKALMSATQNYFEGRTVPETVSAAEWDVIESWALTYIQDGTVTLND